MSLMNRPTKTFGGPFFFNYFNFLLFFQCLWFPV